jgi:hypothetical protein
MRKLDTEKSRRREEENQGSVVARDPGYKENKDMREQFVERLIDTERKLWTNDAVFYKDNLAEDCLLVFPETGVITRHVSVNAIRKENEDGRRWAEVDFDEVHSSRPADNVAMLSYRVAARWEHEKATRKAFASSIYIKSNGTWKLAFHQQTPIE